MPRKRHDVSRRKRVLVRALVISGASRTLFVILVFDIGRERNELALLTDAGELQHIPAAHKAGFCE